MWWNKPDTRLWTTRWRINVRHQNCTTMTSNRPLYQFTFGCSIRVLYFWWFRRHLIDVTPTKSSCTLNHFVIILFSQDVCWAISRNAVPFDVTLCNITKTRMYRLIKVPHAELYVIPGCTIWMYAKLFHAKLCYLMLRCLTWSNTVPFHPRLSHLASRWTVSLYSVPSHVRCSTIPSYPVSIVIMLRHFMYRYPIWHHSSPVIITLCHLNSDR